VSALQRLAANVLEAAEFMSVAESTVWDEIRRNRLRSFKLGRRRS
jgi:hypothetical protein